MIPNPGSDDAVKQGCTCPVLDNSHGKGFPYPNNDGEMVQCFWISDTCPLHSNATKEEE